METGTGVLVLLAWVLMVEHMKKSKPAALSLLACSNTHYTQAKCFSPLTKDTAMMAESWKENQHKQIQVDIKRQ